MAAPPSRPCMDCDAPATSRRCDRCCIRLRNGRPWRTLCRRVWSEERHCWLCGQWVDQSLPRWHRRSRTVDHVKQLRDGGPPLERSNCRMAHRGCNAARSNRLRGRRARRGLLVVDPHSV